MQSKKAYPFTRKNERIPLEGRVFIHDEDHLYIAPLSNLSVGGVFVARLMTLKEGAEVRIVIKSGRLGSVVQAKGKIVRVDKSNRGGSAVQFDALTAESLKAIRSCVEESHLEEATQVA